MGKNTKHTVNQNRSLGITLLVLYLVCYHSAATSVASIGKCQDPQRQQLINTFKTIVAHHQLYDQPRQSHIVQATPQWYDWITFSIGILLGGSIELATNVTNKCVAGIATVLQSLYLVYYYINNYLQTSEEDSIAYAVAYLVKMFRSGFTVDCTGGIAFWLPNPLAKKPKLEAGFNDIQDVFNTMFKMIGDLQEMLSLIEVYIDTKTIYNEWIAGDYFESGLYTGKNVVNIFFTGYAIILKYVAFFQ